MFTVNIIIIIIIRRRKYYLPPEALDQGLGPVLAEIEPRAAAQLPQQRGAQERQS
jgi:hypothetical protein